MRTFMMSFMIILMTLMTLMTMTMTMTIDDDGIHVRLYTEAVFA